MIKNAIAKLAQGLKVPLVDKDGNILDLFEWNWTSGNIAKSPEDAYGSGDGISHGLEDTNASRSDFGRASFAQVALGKNPDQSGEDYSPVKSLQTGRLIDGAGAGSFGSEEGEDFGHHASLGAAVAVNSASGDALSGVEHVPVSAHGDWIFGDSGDDILVGGNGDDKIEGRAGNDTLIGGAGNDELIGDSALKGQAGNDMLDGGEGDDYLWGGDGDDLLMGGAGADKLNGAQGTDTADYTASDAGVFVELDAGPGRDGGYGEGGHAQGDTLYWIENVTGSAYDDEIHGQRGDVVNLLSGGAGNDRLYGYGGDDVLIGGKGADVLDGGEGPAMTRPPMRPRMRGCGSTWRKAVLPAAMPRGTCWWGSSIWPGRRMATTCGVTMGST